MSARTILKHLHQQGRMTDYQFDVINRNLKERPQGEWITMETEKVQEILRDLCKHRESGYCLNRVYGSVDKCECQCLQDIFYDYEEDNYD